MNFKIVAPPSHFSIFYLVKITKIGLFMCSFKICKYFLSQNFSLCSPCIYCLNPRRIEQYSNVFVVKRPLKNSTFVMKMGFVRFVFSTTELTLRLWSLKGLIASFYNQKMNKSIVLYQTLKSLIFE